MRFNRGLLLLLEREQPKETGEQTDQQQADFSFCPPSSQLRDLLMAAYDADPLVSEDDDDSGLEFRDQLWWFNDCVFVPVALRPRVLQEFHDIPTSGHPVSENSGFNHSDTMVARPEGGCDCIHQNLFFPPTGKAFKSETTRADESYEVPSRPWSAIAFDYIVKLPILSGFDSVLVVVDHFSKGVHFIPAKETWAAEEFAFAFFNWIIRLHGLPDKIISDRGSLFISKFWKEVQRLFQIKAAPSTAWHLRTDGPTERANQTVEIFLRHFVSDRL